MPTFEVVRDGTWYVAECSEMGLGITARELAGIRDIASRAVERAGLRDQTIVLVVRDATPGLLARLAAILVRRPR